MAVRNGMPYLPAAVESILSQTFTDFEFLIIDDHSTDMSPGYLDSLKDPRVRILPNPGKGLTAALNFGLQQSKGEWIARMDADDWSFPTRLAQEYDTAKKPDVVLISANYVVCDEDLNPAGEIRLSQPNEKLFTYLHQEIPYALTVETDLWERKEDGSVKAQQTIYVERDNQKSIILGKAGAMIKRIGQSSRIELEELLECKVHLFLFVKVRENWMNDSSRYEDWNLDFNA